MYPIDVFRRAAALHPERIAAQAGPLRIRYDELQARIDAIAAGLQALAGRERITVALLCPNSLGLLAGILAVHACGGMMVPLNPKNTAAELQSQWEVAQPDVLVLDPSCQGLVHTGGRPVVVAGEAGGAGLTLDALARRHVGARPEWPAVRPEDPYAIKFTGGSSGRPKGVVQSFRSHVAVIVHVLLGLGFADAERYLCAAPMTHGAGSFVLPTLAVGGTVQIAQGLKAAALLDTMSELGTTATWVPPSLLYALLDEQQRMPRSLPRLRHLVFGGAPTAPERIEQGLALFGPVLETTFGQTEASTIATALQARELADPVTRLSVGRTCPLVRVAVVDPQGHTLAPGESGEIVVAGDLLMNGYLGMPEETEKTMRHGWLHTGDVGCFDERGYLYIKDRIRDVVITGGFNVYPSDVEAAMARHPAVRECVVFGVPDAQWGERVEAAVELHERASATPEALIAFAREQLGAVKAPKGVHIVSSLPRSPVGKVQRREAKAMFASR